MGGKDTAIVLRGLVYGDIAGAPFREENTNSRYFELGVSRRVTVGRSVRTFHPEVTEVSLGAAAVCDWLTRHGDPQRSAQHGEQMLGQLRRRYEAHPRAPWTEGTRLLLTAGGGRPSALPDWAAVARAAPLAPLLGDDLNAALDACRVCVGATCTDPDTARTAQAFTHAVHMALGGRGIAGLTGFLEKEYGLQLSRGEDALRSLLRGDAERLSQWARTHARPAAAPPSPRLVTEAALTAVLRSDSWEDAVRRAVSLGGPSHAVAGMAGALAAALYGDISPSAAGRLTAFVPSDILPLTREPEGTALRPRERSSGERIEVIRSRRDGAVYIIPSGREDIREAVSRLRPGAGFITPDDVPGYLAAFRETRTGTFVYGDRPEVRTLYLQDGRIVSPSRVAAPDMPPLSERRRHLEAFLSLKAWCRERQEEMNAHAGNVGAGQVHYPAAYHMWIGTDRIDFLMGDTLTGSVRLDGRGLLAAEPGEYREPGGDIRFGNARELLWQAGGVFSPAVARDPAGNLDQLRSDIMGRLLDEGVGIGTDGGGERYGSGASPREEISNLDRLTPLDAGERPGTADSPSIRVRATAEKSGDARRQVSIIYSIGYGNRSMEGFLNALHMFGIDTVVDIRAVPHNRYCPQFDEETVFAALGDADIAYYSAGEKLGARPSDPVFRGPGGRIDWARVRDSGPYLEGIAAVESMTARGHTVAVVSAEGDPLASHRFALVARSLSEDGYSVRHLLPDGEVMDQTRLEDRLLGKYIRRGMIPSAGSAGYAVQLGEAYEAMNREYGYRTVQARRRGGRL